MSDQAGAHAAELLNEGRLTEAISHQAAQTASHPTSLEIRGVLFALLCHAGAWDRAAIHLGVLRSQTPEASRKTVSLYHDCLTAECARLRVFSESPDLPEFLPEAPPDPIVERHLALLKDVYRGGSIEAMIELEEERPPFPGRCNGEPFTDWHDCDLLTWPALEAFHQGRYVWIPWTSVARVVWPGRRGLPCDYLWAEALVVLRGGASLVLVTPLLYPHSVQSPDESVRAGIASDSIPFRDNVERGVGRHLFCFYGMEETPRHQMLLDSPEGSMLFELGGAVAPDEAGPSVAVTFSGENHPEEQAASLLWNEAD